MEDVELYLTEEENWDETVYCMRADLSRNCKTDLKKLWTLNYETDASSICSPEVHIKIYTASGSLKQCYAGLVSS
jgi:hypothetical protein